MSDIINVRGPSLNVQKGGKAGVGQIFWRADISSFQGALPDSMDHTHWGQTNSSESYHGDNAIGTADEVEELREDADNRILNVKYFLGLLFSSYMQTTLKTLFIRYFSKGGILFSNGPCQ